MDVSLRVKKNHQIMLLNICSFSQFSAYPSSIVSHLWAKGSCSSPSFLSAFSFIVCKGPLSSSIILLVRCLISYFLLPFDMQDSDEFKRISSLWSGRKITLRFLCRWGWGVRGKSGLWGAGEEEREMLLRGILTTPQSASLLTECVLRIQ